MVAVLKFIIIIISLAQGHSSHLNDFFFSACLLVNNQLCISSFAPDNNYEIYVEDFSGAFLYGLSV